MFCFELNTSRDTILMLIKEWNNRIWFVAFKTSFLFLFFIQTTTKTYAIENQFMRTRNFNLHKKISRRKKNATEKKRKESYKVTGKKWRKGGYKKDVWYKILYPLHNFPVMSCRYHTSTVSDFKPHVILHLASGMFMYYRTPPI